MLAGRGKGELGIGFRDVHTQQSSLEDIFVSLVHRAAPQQQTEEAAR